jgi:hypothetical protein
LPSHYFGKVPALARIFNDGVKRSDNYYNILTGIEEHEGESGLKKWRQFKKRDKGEYSRVKDYLVKRDREAYGYKVIMTKAGFELRDPDGNRIRTFQNQQEAWTAAIEHEGATLANAGYSDMAVDAVKTFRKITHNGFELLKGHMNKIIRRYQEAGKPLPKVAIFVEGEKVMVDLNVALAKMGDVRGYYFPRVRKGGRFTAYANDLNQDETTMRNPELVHFDSEWLASKYKAEKEAQGYKVEVRHRKKMPEDVYEAAGNIASLSALLNQSLENMSDHKEAMKKVELEFAKALTEQISDLIKMRGVRSHMISRNTATGNKVWLGYEEDPAQALAKYAQGVAAGEAKKIMALDMLRHFTGTDISWKDFKAQRIAEHLRSIGAAIPEDLEPGALRNTISLELADRGIAAKDIVKYKDYMEFVKARKVDPINQKNAFKDGQTYIDDMLRNDEFIDRFIGNVKGLSVLWYLAGRVSAPVVNMTAMVTSVPAVMKGVAGIPIPKALAMWPRAMNAYRDFSGFGGGRRANLDPWVAKGFEDMERQGWHKAQYNKEALMILKSRVGQGWDSVINGLMLGFGVTEKWNRVSTIMGTYMALKEKNATAFDQASESEKLKMHNKWMATAKEVSDMAHAVYGKANRPHYGRGSNVAARAIQAFYVFKTFSHNYMLEMIDLGYNKREYQAAAFMAMSPAILAGAAASPLLAALFKAFQLGGSDDPEESFYEWVEANLGGGASELARLGFFSKLGVSLKGSLQINVTDIPTTLKDFAGAPGALFTDMYLGTKSLARGDYSKAVEKMSPKFAGNAFRAWREYHQGLTTNSNAPVFYGKERVKLDLTEAILRGLSFNPARVAAIREKQFKEALLADKYSQARNDINARMKAFYLTPKEKRDPDTYVDILNDIRAYNNKVKSKGLPFPYITGQSIQNNIRRSMKPNKRERQRAAEIPLLK